jgi:hypothetical protein
MSHQEDPCGAWDFELWAPRPKIAAHLEIILASKGAMAPMEQLPELVQRAALAQISGQLQACCRR